MPNASFNPTDESCVLDIALQLTGAVENVFEIIRDNSYIPNIHFDAFSGLDVAYTQSSNDIAVYFSRKGLNLSTKYPQAVIVGDFNLDFNKDFNS